MKIFIPLCALFSFIFVSCGGANSTATDSAVIEDVAVTETVETEQPKTNWVYSESVDEMTDKTVYVAANESENYAEFDFPYEGGSYLTFVVRDSPQFGKDMYIKISQGQFNSNVNGDKIQIRFDDEEAFSLNCDTASDYSSDILFLKKKDFNRILEKLRNSKTMKINAEFFNEGNHTFTFNVSGLEWNH